MYSDDIYYLQHTPVDSTLVNVQTRLVTSVSIETVSTDTLVPAGCVYANSTATDVSVVNALVDIYNQISALPTHSPISVIKKELH